MANTHTTHPSSTEVPDHPKAKKHKDKSNEHQISEEESASREALRQVRAQFASIPRLISLIKDAQECADREGARGSGK